MQLQLLAEIDPNRLDHWQVGELAVWINRFGFDITLSKHQPLPKPYLLELEGDYQQAADIWTVMGLPYNAAVSLIQGCDGSSAVGINKAYKLLDAMRAKATIALLKAKAKDLGILGKLPRQRRGPYKATRQHPIGLTGKEQEVLRFIVIGASNQDIAATLSRSQRTIENHVSSILSKLNVSNRMEAMLRVQNEPWLSPSED